MDYQEVIQTIDIDSHSLCTRSATQRISNHRPATKTQQTKEVRRFFFWFIAVFTCDIHLFCNVYLGPIWLKTVTGENTLPLWNTSKISPFELIQWLVIVATKDLTYWVNAVDFHHRGNWIGTLLIKQNPNSIRWTVLD